MTEPERPALVMFDGRSHRPPREALGGGMDQQRGPALPVNPYHLVPAGSTRTLCGDYDVTGWRVVDVPWGGFYDCPKCRATRGR